MAGFFGIALRNFFKPPTTDPYPFGETFMPDTYRGIVAWEQDKCIGCSTCQHVCPSGAIQVEEGEDKVSFSFWMNSCCFCGNCGFFCPTDAVAQAPDFHTATVQADKYKKTVHGFVPLVECSSSGCNKKIKPIVAELLARAYDEVGEQEKHQTTLCPECRRVEQFERLYK